MWAASSCTSEREALEMDGRDPVWWSSRMSWKNDFSSMFARFGTLSVRNRPGIYFFHNLVSGLVSCQRAWAVGFLTSRHSPGKPYRDHLHIQKRSLRGPVIPMVGNVLRVVRSILGDALRQGLSRRQRHGEKVLSH